MEAENSYTKSKMEDYEGIEQIGRGALGAAFLVLHKTENKKYVLKKIRLSKQPEKFKCTAHQEMLPKLHHPYILEYKDVWVDKGSCICTVTNYCEGGNISEKIRKARGAYFPEEKICKWLTQLLLAIDYLHSNRVLHRNLKLSNIFITKENDARLGDFGLSKLLDEEVLASPVVATPNYMCPEVFADTPYGYKSDIWSLGCCFFEIAAHKQAFRAPDMAGLMNKINRSLISPLPIIYSSTLKQIIKTMLRKCPEHRPTAAELLRHPHLQPFLLRCHNPSTVFLPVKSPSPNNTKEKMSQKSPTDSCDGKESGEREMKLKQKELLPLFEENSDVQYLNLLDGDDALIEVKLETKRVDPTSYSGKSSQESEDSNDQEISDSSSHNVTTLPSNVISKVQEEYSPKKITEAEKSEIVCEKETKEDDDAVNSDKVSSFFQKVIKLSKETVIAEVDAKSRSSSSDEENTPDLRRIEKEDPHVINHELGNNQEVRADALESLLELCARLLKQEKLDELNGVLKAFGEDGVSSRETAIWLTKSLMNAQKFAKES